MSGRRRVAVALAAVGILALAACGNDKETGKDAGGGSAKTVGVTVKEWVGRSGAGLGRGGIDHLPGQE